MNGVNKMRSTTKPQSVSRWHRFFRLRRQDNEPKPSVAVATRMRGAARSSTRRTSASYLVVFLLVVMAVAGAFVFHLHVRFQGVWLGYETSRARAERARLLIERRELRLELASLKSPARIETEAREKLGMEMPDHDRIIPIGKKLTPILASGRVR